MSEIRGTESGVRLSGRTTIYSSPGLRQLIHRRLESPDSGPHSVRVGENSTHSGRHVMAKGPFSSSKN